MCNDASAQFDSGGLFIHSLLNCKFSVLIENGPLSSTQKGETWSFQNTETRLYSAGSIVSSTFNYIFIYSGIFWWERRNKCHFKDFNVDIPFFPQNHLSHTVYMALIHVYKGSFISHVKLWFDVYLIPKNTEKHSFLQDRLVKDCVFLLFFNQN